MNRPCFRLMSRVEFLKTPTKATPRLGMSFQLYQQKLITYRLAHKSPLFHKLPHERIVELLNKCIVQCRFPVNTRPWIQAVVKQRDSRINKARLSFWSAIKRPEPLHHRA